MEPQAPNPAPINPSPLAPPEIPQPTPVPQPPAPPKKKTGLIILITVLVTGLVAAGAWLVVKNKTKTSPQANQTVQKKPVDLVRFVINEGPIIYYPTPHESTDQLDVEIQMFEGLVGYQDQTKLVPLLAETWSNPDTTTWVFNLKHGVKFHTNREMTASDVKASIETIKKGEEGELYADTIKSVTAVDDYTVKITTTIPDPTLLNKLSFLYIFDTKSGKTNDPINGTGPYTTKPGTTAGPKNLDLVAFTDYHGGKPLVRELKVSHNQNAEQIYQDVADGKQDITNVYSLSDKTIKPFIKLTYSPLSVNYVGLNSAKSKSPLANIKVRQAIYQAIDVGSFMKAYGIEDAKPASQFVTSEIPGYNPTVKRPTLNVNGAQQLLKQAGYPNGVDLTFTYFKPSEAAAKELARQLKPIGIRLQLDPQTDTSVLGDKVFGGQTDLWFASYATDILDSSDVFNKFFRDSPNYSNPVATKLIDTANGTFDRTIRQQQLQNITKILMDDVAWVPLYAKTGAVAASKPLVFTRDVPGIGVGVFFWKVYQP